ncbi:MAG: Tex family protein [Chloroflexota bacterium]|nr:Tex family protein [Chloroflexota bacterium]
MTHIKIIANELIIKPEQVSATIKLLDADNTIPFIARYRKEATSGLDEVQIRQIAELLEQLRTLDKRRKTVLKTIQEQGKLTPELRSQIQSIETRTELEDIYRPYKPKRKTRASIAREKGLQELADSIIKQIQTDETPEQLASKYINDAVPDNEEALSGARDIVAEVISDHPIIRQTTRKKALEWGQQSTKKTDHTDDQRGVYKQYYDHEFRVSRLQPHQILAINRAENENVLSVSVSVPEQDWRGAIADHFRSERRSPLAEQLELTIDDAANRLLLPAIARDIRRTLTQTAEEHAIRVFAKNLRALLNQPPLPGHTVMGIDPGYRTGCKVAVVDPTGKSLSTATIYPHPPQKQSFKAIETITQLVRQHDVSLIAIGNGTASRETEQLIADLIQESQNIPEDLHYIIVSESGASVYSASKVARSELPNMDVSMRGAVSIARRLQDPLAELVKIDPKSLGVGMYQHDIDQKSLTEALDTVVESVVNKIGVNVNTASPSLLSHISGIGSVMATRIVEYRDENGPFQNRKSLLDIRGLGPKSFEQAAGFLRILDGDNRLDGTSIHPESYPTAETVMQLAGLGLDCTHGAQESTLKGFRQRTDLGELATKLGTGTPTLEDIIQQLIHPGRDPRQYLPKTILRSDVLKMDDLSIGMRLKGTVRNVVDFGAFVDIGAKQDGLLHRSQIPRGEQVQVGDIIDIKIQKVEIERGRISLGWGDNQ